MKLNRRTALKAVTAAMAGFAGTGTLAAQAQSDTADLDTLDHLVTRHRRVHVEGVRAHLFDQLTAEQVEAMRDLGETLLRHLGTR